MKTSWLKWRMKTWAVVIAGIVALAAFAFNTQTGALQLDESTLDFYAENNIFYYDPSCVEAGGDVSVCSANLPEATIEAMESAGVKEKAEANIERYKYAEEQTGIPWQAIAALHWREAGMASDRSISNGQVLAAAGTCYTNVDGLSICSDPNQDAKEAAEHLISMAKWVYDVELTASSTVDEWGQAFLAYNRGVIYKRAGVDWKESPYPMNGFDEEHALWMERPWVENTSPMYLTGRDLNVGALAIFAYLCGDGSGGGGASSSASSPGVLDEDITLIGDSIGVQAENELKLKFPGGFFTKVGSRHPTSRGVCANDEGGLAVLQTVVSGSGVVIDQHATDACETVTIDSSSLKGNVVWELGGNETGATRDTMEKVVELVGNRNLFLVTPYNGLSPSTANSIAKMYRDVAEEYSNVYIVDWNKAVSENESAYITRADGMAVHPTQAGKQLLADLIAEAVEGASGCEMVSYDDSAYQERLENLHTLHQSRGTWRDRSDGCASGGSVALQGCGLMSIYAAYYMFTGKGIDDEATFDSLVKAAVEDGYYGCGGADFSNYGENLKDFTGIKAEYLWSGSYSDSQWDDYVNELKKGNKLLISTTGTLVGGSSLFAYKYHALLLDHYNEEKDAIYLFDPSINESKVSTSGAENTTGNIRDGVYITRDVMNRYLRPDSATALIYKDSSCYNICESGLGKLEGGLTDEQAQILADYFNGDKGDIAGRKYNLNCPEVVKWFLYYFTDLGYGDPSTFTLGNGGDVAHTLAQEKGLEEGNEPRPFAVFSTVADGIAFAINPSTGLKYGHTGLIVAVNGDELTTLETGSGNAQVLKRSASALCVSNYSTCYTYLDGHINESELSRVLGGA